MELLLTLKIKLFFDIPLQRKKNLHFPFLGYYHSLWANEAHGDTSKYLFDKYKFKTLSVHVMKKYKGRRSIAQFILNRGAR